MTPDPNEEGDASPSPEYSGADQDQDHDLGLDQDREGLELEQEDINMKDSHAAGDDGSDSSPHSAGGNGSTTKVKPNAKDPNRPRRKKARRACFACQRAHLTCGDERPCQRCIKRGLAEHCHDGVRKKAKYLHDTPNEALMPGVGGFHHINGSHGASMPGLSGSVTLAQPASYFPQAQQGGFPNYMQNADQQQMGPHMQDQSMLNTFNQQTPLAAPFVNKPSQQSPPTMQNMQGSMSQTSPQNQIQNQPVQFGGPLFDPSDPAIFNLDLASFNFGSHYGALEFGMLGHMASGAAETPSVDASSFNPMNQQVPATAANFNTPGTVTTGYTDSPSQSYLYGQDATSMTDWQQSQQHPQRLDSAGTMYSGINGIDTIAYAINNTHPTGFSESSPGSTGYDHHQGDSPISSYYNSQQQYQPHHQPQPQHHQPSQQHQQQLFTRPPQHHARPQLTKEQSERYFRQQLATRKRRRDASSIYSSVTSPYPYPDGFHQLTAYLKRRFSTQKVLRIAQSLAKIRPSFIACTKTLTTDDLVFMEKCFQRTLWEYEDFLDAYGTPTVICRRTGEVAAVSKEFTLLTGWRRDVLLGNEPNLNINTGGGSASSGDSTQASSRGGFNTPSQRQPTDVPNRPQPVFLAELLDDDSVIQFYEDFAKLAFGDSRGSVRAPCKLLKYKTKEDVGWGSDANGNGNGVMDTGARDEGRSPRMKRHRPVARVDKGYIGHEAGMSDLGDREGKVECSYCWMVKRDVFDIPMMVVINFLPCI